MTEPKDDRYINSFRMKEKTFDDGNSIIAVDIDVDDFIEKLKSIPKNEAGYAKLRIVRRKSPSEYGHTHFLAVYTPKSKENDKTEPDTKKKEEKRGVPKKRKSPF